MFVVFKNDVAVTNGGLIAHCPLDQAWRPSRKIVHQLRLSFGDSIDVDNIDVRSFPYGKGSSVIKADHSRLGASQFANGLRETEGALIAMPMAEQERSPTRVHDLTHVSTGIADPG